MAINLGRGIVNFTPGVMPWFPCMYMYVAYHVIHVIVLRVAYRVTVCTCSLPCDCCIPCRAGLQCFEERACQQGVCM